MSADPAALGTPVAAWVPNRAGPGQLQKICELADVSPEVSEYRVSGADCFLVRRVVAGTPALADPIAGAHAAPGVPDVRRPPPGG